MSPNSPLGRPAAEINAEQDAIRDAMPLVTRCLHCDFLYVGTVAEGRKEAFAHRLMYHPDAKQTKRRRTHVSRFNPGLESDRVAGEARAADTARMLARRSANEAVA